MTKRKKKTFLVIPILTLTLVLCPAYSFGATGQVASQGVEETDTSGKGSQDLQNNGVDQETLSSQDNLADQTVSESEEAAFEPFIRIDRDDPNAWKEELDNVRFEKEGLYKFGETKAKYGIDDINPSEEGLDDLCISASAQFSFPQFVKLADELRDVADGREIYILDLRGESHVLLGGIPVSWYESKNWGNLDYSLEEIEADEFKRFAPLIGQTIKVYGVEDDVKLCEADIDVNGLLREKELVESFGFHYVRLPARDHGWPQPEVVDAFVDFVKEIDMDNSWLHFHCQAGQGRTGIFMTMYDKMKNPEVPMMDVTVRQTKLGGGYPLYTEDDPNNYKTPLYEEKARMMPLFCEYVEENHESGYEVSWSEWLAENEETAQLQPAA